MNSMIYRFSHFSRDFVTPIQCAVQTRNYAGPPKTKKVLTSSVEKKLLPVETDTYRLQTHVCGTNLLKEGGEDVKIKPDSEYPSWLWTLRTGPPPPLEEMDPNTKQYWRKVRSLGLKQNNKIKATKKF